MAKNHRLALALVLAVAWVSGTEGQQDRKTAAQTIWNQAIEAKGGRARLEGVRNLVVTERTIYARSRLRDYDPGFTRQRLYVFPGRLWMLVDHRPGKLGVGFQIFDLERRVVWNDAGRLSDRQWTADRLRNDMVIGQLLFLLETRFVTPEPTGARSGTVGRVAADIVEVQVPASDIRAEYYLDRLRHLPLRVVLFYTVRQNPNSSLPRRDYALEDRYTLGNYVDVDGLQMPTIAMAEGANTQNTTSYRINVDYDERTFTPPPPGPLRDPEMAVLNGWQTR